MPTIGEALCDAATRLAAAGHESPRLEAEVLLAAASGLTRTTFIAWPERPLDATAAAELERLVGRRLTGEPIAYLLGRREFWGLELAVTPATLIPRPDTELLVETALASLPGQAPLRIADLGAGCGAIACALAHDRPRWTLLAVERSASALAVTASNARRLGLSNLLPIQGDWLASLGESSLDAVVSNPPYIRADDAHLDRGDLRFEPRTALAAGGDGLDAIRAILAQIGRCLRPGGWLALEHGWDQGEAVRALFTEAGLTGIETRRDLAGHERLSCAHRRE